MKDESHKSRIVQGITGKHILYALFMDYRRSIRMEELWQCVLCMFPRDSRHIYSPTHYLAYMILNQI